MKLANYLKPEHIFIFPASADTHDFYQKFSLFLKERGFIEDPRSVKRLFLKRESVHSTGIGQGAATPHVFSSEFSQFAIYVALVREGVDFKSPDGIPVHLVFLIVSDDRDVGLHLKSLAHIARMVLNTPLVEEAKAAATEKALFKLLLDTEKNI